MTIVPRTLPASLRARFHLMPTFQAGLFIPSLFAAGILIFITSGDTCLSRHGLVDRSRWLRVALWRRDLSNPMPNPCSIRLVRAVVQSYAGIVKLRVVGAAGQEGSGAS